MSYNLVQITPISQLSGKDLRLVDLATQSATKSKFEHNKRVGACLEGKHGQCLLCGLQSA